MGSRKKSRIELAILFGGIQTTRKTRKSDRVKIHPIELHGRGSGRVGQPLRTGPGQRRKDIINERGAEIIQGNPEGL